MKPRPHNIIYKGIFYLDGDAQFFCKNKKALPKTLKAHIADQEAYIKRLQTRLERLIHFKKTGE